MMDIVWPEGPDSCAFYLQLYSSTSSHPPHHHYLQSSTHSSHHRTSTISFVLLPTLFVLVILWTTLGMAGAAPSSSSSSLSSHLKDPRWVDPCRAQSFIFAGVKYDIKEVYDTIIAASRMAKIQAERIKHKFVSTHSFLFIPSDSKTFTQTSSTSVRQSLTFPRVNWRWWQSWGGGGCW